MGRACGTAAVGVPLAVNAPSACQDDAATTGVAGGGAAAGTAPGGATMAAAAARRSVLRLKAAARWTVSWDRQEGRIHQMQGLRVLFSDRWRWRTPWLQLLGAIRAAKGSSTLCTG